MKIHACDELESRRIAILYFFELNYSYSREISEGMEAAE
jgi:hypothetical protein